MNAQQTLQAIIEDLRVIRHASQSFGFENVPDVAWDYLSVNYDIIHSYLIQVYTKLDEDQRMELLKRDRILDKSAVGNGWYSIAVSALQDAKYRAEYGSTINIISEDDIVCLMRGLEFAKYLPLDESDQKLSLSPIVQHGLGVS